jgi:hypothetical protein
MKTIKPKLGIIVIIIGTILTIGGIVDPEGHVVIPFGLIFLVLGIIVFRRKRADVKKKTEPVLLNKQTEQPDTINQSHKKVYRESVITPSLAKRGIGMAKCRHCGKGGLFHKVNENGLCVDCARIEALEIEAQKLQEDIYCFSHGNDNCGL